MPPHPSISTSPRLIYAQSSLFDLPSSAIGPYDREETIPGAPVRCGFETPIRRCIHCRQILPASAFNGHRHCPDCLVVHRRAAHKKYRRYRERILLAANAARYGITTVEYQALFEQQDGLCAICGLSEAVKSKYGRTKSLAIDHNHRTGKVRGLLCARCNMLVAHLENNAATVIEAARDYLTRHEPV